MPTVKLKPNQETPGGRPSVILKNGKLSCTCCEPPGPYTFRLGLSIVEVHASKSRCASLNGLSDAWFSHIDWGNPEIQHLPVAAEDFYFYNYEALNPGLCKWSKEINVTEPNSSRTLCINPNPEQQEAFNTPVVDNFGFQYLKKWVESETNTTDISGDQFGLAMSSIFRKRTLTDSSCNIQENRTGGLSVSSARPGAWGLGTITHPGSVTESSISFDSFEVEHWTKCDTNNGAYSNEDGEADYKSMPGSTANFSYDETENSDFKSQALARLPAFPEYPSPDICSGADILMLGSADSSWKLTKGWIFESTEPVTIPEGVDCGFENRSLASVYAKKTKFKIVHNISPTGYLKVWIKRGKINPETGDFLSSSIETYEIETDPQTIPNKPCTLFYSQEFSLDVAVPDLSELPTTDIYGFERFEWESSDEYAYILKYSFAPDYAPPTTGTGINERCSGDYCNGYPPPPTPP